MNRQQRRGGKGRDGAAGASRLDQAISHHQSGRLDEAESLYRELLALDPRNSDCWHLRGVIALQKGRPEEAIELIAKAIGIRGNVAAFHSNLGNALRACGRHPQAAVSCRRAISLEPNFAEAHNNFGYALAEQGMLDEAALCYGRALAINPTYTEARLNLGDLRQAQGRLGDALDCFEHVTADQPDNAYAHFRSGNLWRALLRMDAAAACYERALSLRPDMTEAAFNLGNTRRDQGQYAAAEACYRYVVERKPADIAAWINLGNCCRETGRQDEAIQCFLEAREFDEQRAETNYNLALTLIEAGRSNEALIPAIAALQHEASPANQSLIVDCLAHIDPNAAAADDLPALGEIVIHALSEGWGRPELLVANALRLFKSQAFIATAIGRMAASGTPAPQSPCLNEEEWQILAADRLFLSLLRAAPLADMDVERLLTGLRREMLHRAFAADTPAGQPLELYCAIAQQCFIDEYVLAATAAELALAGQALARLTATLAEGRQPAPILLAAIAAYFPLRDVPRGESLPAYPWPESITALLTQQVAEPQAEARLRDEIPRLTGITDDVSVQVQRQYEEHPYPRWIRTGGSAGDSGISERMRRQFPLVSMVPLRTDSDLDILVAGCGTGQQSITTALNFPAAHILAIDLSLASLAYAARKTREMGLGNVAYGQADILQLDRLERSFDLIECGGVLHHLADPFAGWRALLSILRPNGLMRLGLYSELARRDVVAAREFIAARGFGQGTEAIREARQAMIAYGAGAPWGPVLNRRDFYTTSECRDLLFHVQEHRLNLAAIRAFLDDNNLAFLGFELDFAILSQYRRRFPDDPAAVDLACWQSFEHDHPDTFCGMYQFWVQRKPSRTTHAENTSAGVGAGKPARADTF